MSLSPSIPDAPNPAKRPERKESINPEDITVGSEDQEDDTSQRGRRALRRPSGSAASSGSVGTGLSA